MFEKRVLTKIFGSERERNCHCVQGRETDDTRMEKNCKQGASLVVFFAQNYSDYETRENEMGGACGMWGKKRMPT